MNPNQIIPEVGNPLTARMHKGVNSTLDEGQTIFASEVSPALMAGGNKTGGDRPPGSQVDTVDSLIAFHGSQDPDISGDIAHPIGRNQGQETVVAYDMRGRECGSQFEGPHDTANIRAASGGSSRSYIAQQWDVRRLMPVECERLQGFPDGFTDIEENTPDGPRYKALGNSMAVNVMRWIGKRIDFVATLGEN